MYLIALAVIPGLVFLYSVWKLDKIEKEPVKLLLLLVLLGMFACVPAVLLEEMADMLQSSVMERGTLFYILIENFLGVALIEELCKYTFLKAATWKSREFNYLFDGIVYAVCVGIGFAILENIFYVTDGGVSVAILRSLTSIPGHGIYGIIMGHYYSMARFQMNYGDAKLSKKWLRRALIIPTLLHGFYDFCLSADSILLVLIIFIVTIALYIVAYNRIRRYSKNDNSIVWFYRS